MLFFWRQGFEPNGAMKIGTKNLFVEKDLYAVVDDHGVKNIALEKFFSDLESAAASFIRQLCDIVRAGKVPKLDDEAWKFWHTFYYYQIKRTPGYMAPMVERVGFQLEMQEAVAALKADEEAAGITDGHDGLEERLFKNAVVIAQATKPSDEVMELFQNLGLVVHRITDPRKSFVVGDVPGAAAVIRGRDDTESGKAVFIPITPDIAIGYMLKPKTVEVYEVTTEQVRRMNQATAARSGTIAGTSAELLTSLARSVTYVGAIPFENGNGFNGM